ncbi:SDR family oxidoreductase [Acinetobacter baumannii]|uniref:SDR family oxidoreductase n=1 Tax=Acinetobacter baumannii TaxID=470 RepID=UPI00244AF058|nr:SDR family oxidoreductase [Acinetobacter baumannii]MDH2549374.1 SDR family oxidoreductase [Acinetobacter baumannii]MDO7519889.1 SDR family oxidoreductase [Acinetobacter baumannii]
MKRIWFVTGTTRGMGVEIVKAAIQQGDSVIATGRSLSKLKALYANLPSDQIELVELDIRDEQQVKTAVEIGLKRFGQIDVLVNNAGYPLLGRFEEATAEQIQQQFSTNVFGTAHVLRAVLPHMRKQKSGYIINTSSIAGVKSVPNATFYSASKFAVEAMTLALAEEVAPFGIQVTAIEPGFFRTEFLSDRSADYGSVEISDYPVSSNARSTFGAADGTQQGDPSKLAQVVMQLADMQPPPRQLLIGNDAIEFVMPTLNAHLDEIQSFQKLTRSTDY